MGSRVVLNDFRKIKRIFLLPGFEPHVAKTLVIIEITLDCPPPPAFEECAVFCIHFFSVTYSPQTSVSHVGKSSYKHCLNGSDFTTQTVTNNHRVPMFH